jgi:hypothetical protein
MRVKKEGQCKVDRKHGRLSGRVGCSGTPVDARFASSGPQGTLKPVPRAVGVLWGLWVAGGLFNWPVQQRA